MLIQIITHNGESFDTEMSYPNIEYSSFEDLNSLDMYDINILDLQSEELWGPTTNPKYIKNQLNDLSLLKHMIENAHKTKIIVLLPNDNANYVKTKPNYWPLKNNLNRVEGYLKYVPTDDLQMDLAYEKTLTDINGNLYNASFYFNSKINNGVVTQSKSSCKMTSIVLGKCLLTTLNFHNNESLLIEYLKHIGLLETRESLPVWLINHPILDDEQQQSTVKKNEAIIKQAEQEISDAQGILEQNSRYKSILHINGNDLMYVVYDILQEMLSYDLSDFKDEYKEDFVIEIENFAFIGEIKGVTCNVKNEHISQVDVHLQKYKDKLEEENRESKCKSLLIINHQRQKPLNERVAVHHSQIDLAIRNECLIIETATLLKLLENFRENEITTEACIELFKNEIGLLEI